MKVATPADSIANELRVEFFRRGLNHQTVSEISGLSTSAVSRRLNGVVSPTLDELDRLAAAADLTVEVRLVERAA
jgi:transcriptional regulator with XRE-family HTH domain